MEVLIKIMARGRMKGNQIKRMERKLVKTVKGKLLKMVKEGKLREISKSMMVIIMILIKLWIIIMFKINLITHQQTIKRIKKFLGVPTKKLFTKILILNLDVNIIKEGVN